MTYAGGILASRGKMADGKKAAGWGLGVGWLVDHLKSQVGPVGVESGLISWVSAIGGALEKLPPTDRNGRTGPWQAPISQIREIHLGGEVPQTAGDS